MFRAGSSKEFRNAQHCKYETIKLQDQVGYSYFYQTALLFFKKSRVLCIHL